MTIISPSLLACDFLNIETEISSFFQIKDLWFHLDIMDGHFVPNLTFGPPLINLIAKKSLHKCDAHFMVTNPSFYAETLKKSGLFNFTFHIESTPDPFSLVKILKKDYPSCGISLKPETPLSAISTEIFMAVDLVLIMSVEPGFGGQEFIASTFEKISHLKKIRTDLGAHFQIQVDGGVSDKNSKELIARGADNLVAGSYIFKKGDYAKRVESLRS